MRGIRLSEKRGGHADRSDSPEVVCSEIAFEDLELDNGSSLVEARKPTAKTSEIVTTSGKFACSMNVHFADGNKSCLEKLRW